MPDQNRPFLIVRRTDGLVVGRTSTLSRARRGVDRRDNEYGAYVHSIREVVGGKLIVRM